MCVKISENMDDGKRGTSVIPISYTEDIEKLSLKDGQMYVGIEEMSITYIQPADTNSSRDELQHITLTSRQGCAIGIDDALNEQCGYYVDITIPEDEHWSINHPDELTSVVQDFFNRLQMGKEHIKPINDQENE